MRIGEVARRTGVSARMLRYYEAQGLLAPGRHHNDYRTYSRADLDRVGTIRALSAAGVPVRFIRIVLERADGGGRWTRTCNDTLAGLLREQIEDLDSRIGCLTTSRDALAGLLEETPSRRRPPGSPAGAQAP